jgi:hypothetical protein
MQAIGAHSDNLVTAAVTITVIDHFAAKRSTRNSMQLFCFCSQDAPLAATRGMQSHAGTPTMLGSCQTNHSVCTQAHTCIATTSHQLTLCMTGCHTRRRHQIQGRQYCCTTLLQQSELLNSTGGEGAALCPSSGVPLAAPPGHLQPSAAPAVSTQSLPWHHQHPCLLPLLG